MKMKSLMIWVAGILIACGVSANDKTAEYGNRLDSIAVYNTLINKADSCYMKQNFGLASKFFDKAFSLGVKPVDKHLYNGACAAALDSYGWPSSEIVGGSNFAIWEIIQHTSLEAIEKYLPLFHNAAADNELNKSFVAMMEDRCDMWRNRPQKYGTQLIRNDNGESVPYDLLDPEKVDEWRKEMDLPPLKEYLEQMNRR